MATFSEYKNPYIESIYDQKKQAAADALTSAYQQNLANYEAQAQETSKTYGDQRNQTQAQYEQALRNYDEYSGANGLNSGAKAQARLAYGTQKQSGMSALSEGEAAALQEIARNRTAAENQYNADIAANEAAYDTDLYNALYAAWQDEQSQANADRDHYYTLAMSSIQTGTVPDSDTLSRAGIDSATAAAMAAYYRGLNTPVSSSGSSGGSSGSSSGKSAGGSSGTGTLSKSSAATQPTATGASSAGTTSSTASNVLNNPYGSIQYNTILGYINSGKLSAANSALAVYSGLLTKEQYNELLSKINAASKTTGTTSKTTSSKTGAAAKTTSSKGGGNKMTTSSLMTR